MKQANVYVNSTLAGTLTEDDMGYEFRYSSDYLNTEGAEAVSLTMPLSDKPFRDKVLFPIFDGLIPEGWLLKVVSRNWKIDSHDRFGILLVACKDGIGNVKVREERI